MDQWKRLTPLVQKQVLWLYNPKKLHDGEKYVKAESNYKDTTLSRHQVRMSQQICDFAEEYDQNNRIELNQVLANWVDLKYDHIWSRDFMKEKKQELKDNSSYYRIVKQGSQLVYISFHIFTIFVIMLMATMRQSIIAMGYVIILLPRVKNGSEVLDQRNMHQNTSKDKKEE
jgi:hypothetical protein